MVAAPWQIQEIGLKWGFAFHFGCWYVRKYSLDDVCAEAHRHHPKRRSTQAPPRRMGNHLKRKSDFQWENRSRLLQQKRACCYSRLCVTEVILTNAYTTISGNSGRNYDSDRCGVVGKL